MTNPYDPPETALGACVRCGAPSASKLCDACLEAKVASRVSPGLLGFVLGALFGLMGAALLLLLRQSRSEWKGLLMGFVVRAAVLFVAANVMH